MAQQVAQSVLGVRTVVDTVHDPVVQILFKGKTDGEVLREEGAGRLFSGLSIFLEERGRVKLAGRVIGGACSRHQTDDKSEATGAGEVQLALKIEQSLGNCPKYLNRKTITPSIPNPKLISSGPILSPEAIGLLAQADLFFIASAQAHEDMDANHRGGPPGFIRVHNTPTHSELIWPEYSGNNLYQTLGNLLTTPRAGLCIPNFTTGAVLYITGTTEVLIGSAASALLAKTKLAVRLTITTHTLVASGLPFRGHNLPLSPSDPLDGRSPYNPRVRYLLSETPPTGTNPTDASPAQGPPPTTASLLAATRLTPTITRYRFALLDPLAAPPQTAGQHVLLDFSSELDMGYAHMRDDDPGSLNDDYLRTFTVSSAPGLGVKGEGFELTVRKVGSVTGWMAWQRPGRGGAVEVGVRGFGGEFVFDLGQEGEAGKQRRVGFVCGGVGVTPLLGQMGSAVGEDGAGKQEKRQEEGLDMERVSVLWSIGVRDVGLVTDTLRRFPALASKGALTVFLTGDESVLSDDEEGKTQLAELLRMAEGKGMKVARRRLQKGDLQEADSNVDEWYLCTAPAMREEIQRWLPEKAFVWENFNY
jgi:hypothetical protein